MESNGLRAQKYQDSRENAKHSPGKCVISSKAIIVTIDVFMVGGAPGAAQEFSVTRSLAPREREVLRLLSTGRPYKQIAADLELSMGTVRTYVRRLYGKLHVNCRTEAVVKYLTHRLNDAQPRRIERRLGQVSRAVLSMHPDSAPRSNTRP